MLWKQKILAYLSGPYLHNNGSKLIIYRPTTWQGRHFFIFVTSIIICPINITEIKCLCISLELILLCICSHFLPSFFETTSGISPQGSTLLFITGCCYSFPHWGVRWPMRVRRRRRKWTASGFSIADAKVLGVRYAPGLRSPEPAQACAALHHRRASPNEAQTQKIYLEYSLFWVMTVQFI